MNTMIEPLESRQMFSAAVASVLALRRDITALSAPLPVLLNSYSTVIGQINTNLADVGNQANSAPILASLRLTFNNDLHTMARAISVTKTLLNQDLVRLVIAEHALARQPANANFAHLVSVDQSLITTQAQDLVTAMRNDAAPIINDFNHAAAILESANPIDATLGTDLSAISSLISTVTSEIQATSVRIETVTVPGFIAAVAANTPINTVVPVNPQNNAA